MRKKSAASWRAHSLRGKNMWQGGATLTCGVAGQGCKDLNNVAQCLVSLGKLVRDFPHPRTCFPHALVSSFANMFWQIYSQIIYF